MPNPETAPRRMRGDNRQSLHTREHPEMPSCHRIGCTPITETPEAWGNSPYERGQPEWAESPRPERPRSEPNLIEQETPEGVEAAVERVMEAVTRLKTDAPHGHGPKDEMRHSGHWYYEGDGHTHEAFR